MTPRTRNGVGIVVADNNIPYIVEHKTAIDDLVQGLLVDEDNPRRTQDGAGMLQQICALVLQVMRASKLNNA